MTESERAEFKRLAQTIVDPNKERKDLLQDTQQLCDLIEAATQFSFDPMQDIAAGDTRLDSGLAVSPTIAALCMRQLGRSAAFIRGTHQAIRESLSNDRPVRVLYAGCGPYALIVLPAMALFSPEQVRFTLLDIHQEALDGAMALIDKLGFGGYINDAVCMDATRYAIEEGREPDIIVSETMAVCLRDEPQVTIARHLLAQAPKARLVPQSVSVELCLLDPAKEFAPAANGQCQPAPEVARDRILLGKIFELNADNVRAWAGHSGDSLPAARVSVPVGNERRYLPYMLTNIVTYGEHRMHDYDSSLTIPRAMDESLRAGGTLQFRYELGAHPELAYEIVA